MTWTKPSALLMLSLLLLQGCGIYSFLGISVPSKAKNFSLQVQSNVALGPPDLAEKFQQRLGNELVQRTPLKQIYTKGDLQLEGVIKQFRYVSIASAKKDEGGQAFIDQLTIEVQMNYINPYNEEASFSKKTFSQYANASADTNRGDEEPRLIEEIFTKLIKDIFNETVASW
jgi:Lipopolysaccharide-assembly